MSLILRQSNLPNTGPDYIKGSPLTYDQLDGNFAAISASLAIVPIYPGPGIIINGQDISASVRTVNGIFPTNGNINVSITSVITGPLSTRPITAADATVFVVSQDVPSANGDAYIFVASTGLWEPIAPLDQVQTDALYLRLDASNAPMQGTLNMGNWDITNVGTMFGTASYASSVTGSGVYGPFGANSVLSASNAATASYITGSNIYGPYGANSVVSASYAANAPQVDTSKILSGSTIIQTYASGLVELTGSSDNTTLLVISGSLVVGRNTTTGLHAVAFGTGSVAVANYSFAHGENVIASQSYSHAEGQGTVAAEAWSHAEGFNTRAAQTYAHAEGSYATASAQYSHAEGFGTITSGFYSHTEGYQTVAGGVASHAEGLNTSASGDYSHAEGSGSQALGPWSHAEGNGTIAYGTGSHAEGIGTIASGSGQLAVGAYNQRNNTTSTFVIGNGSSDASRSDIMRVGGSSVQITGSLVVSSSSTIIGQSVVTGSLNVIGQSLVTGSLIVSSSSAVIGTHTITGSLIVSSSLNVIGRSILTGSLIVSSSSNVIGQSFVTGSLIVSSSSVVIGQSIVTGSLVVSSSGNNQVTIAGSGSSNPLFRVFGSQGELFTVTDSMSGSLFSVNDISGLPILDVRSDQTALLGNYLAPSLNTTIKTTVNTGRGIVLYQVPTASYDGMWVEYIAKSGSNGGMGIIQAFYSSGSEAEANTYNDVNWGAGVTGNINFAGIITGSYLALTGSATTNGWTIKAIIRAI